MVNNPSPRNQAPPTANGSPLPSRERARVRVTRPSAAAGDNPAIRNQAPPAANGSPLPSRERARVRVSRASSPRPAATKPAIQNQAQTAANGSPLPSRERARVRVTSASATLRAGTPALRLFPPPPPLHAASPFPLSPVIPAKAGIQKATVSPAIRNQAQIPASGSLLPSWAYRGRFATLGARASRPQRACARHPHPSPLP